MRLPIYLDYNSTTPVDRRVIESMLPYFTETFGNAASRTHSFGWQAEEAVERGRAQVAQAIGAQPREIVWTSGATESNNLAILGAARRQEHRGRHLVSCTIEHKAVLDPLLALAREGWEVTRIDPDQFGRVSADKVAGVLRDDTTLVTLMAANNEIGTCHPLEEIGNLLRNHSALFHVDAAQALGKMPLDVSAIGVDFLSLSAHKFYGPKGVGALFVRRGGETQLAPTLFGGGHERGLRPGTLNVPLVVGVGAAAEIAIQESETRTQRLRQLTSRLLVGVQAKIEGVTVNGHPTESIPGLVNLSFRGVEGSALLLALPEIALSTGSACTSAQLEPSHVLRGIGCSKSAAHSAIRFGLGVSTTADEVEYVIQRVAAGVSQMRRLNRPS